MYRLWDVNMKTQFFIMPKAQSNRDFQLLETKSELKTINEAQHTKTKN